MSEPIPGAPYSIQTFPGHGRQVPFKIYPSGLQVVANEEETAVYDIMAKLAAEVKELKASKAPTVPAKGGK